MNSWLEDHSDPGVIGEIRESSGIRTTKSSSKYGPSKKYTIDGARILRSGAVYRQKFEAEVQLVDCLADMRFQRENKPVVKKIKSSLDTSIPVINNATSRGMLAAEAATWTMSLGNENLVENAAYNRQLDEFIAAYNYQSESKVRAMEVCDLPDELPPATSQSDIIERLQEKRREKHNYTLDELHVELAKINMELEPLIIDACDKLQDELAESSTKVNGLIEQLTSEKELLNMNRDSLQHIWQALQRQSEIRRNHIKELDCTLANIEDHRILKIRLVITYYCDLLEKVSHMAHADLHRLIDEEAMNINYTILENRRSYANLVARLLMNDVDQEKRQHNQWLDYFEEWVRLNRDKILKEFLEFMESFTAGDPQSVTNIIEEMRLEQCRLCKQRDAMLLDLKDLKPPTSTKTMVYQWNQRIVEISLQLDKLNQIYLKKLYEEYERVCQLCLTRMNETKVYLVNAKVCSEEEADKTVKQFCLPLIGKRQAAFESHLEEIDKAFDALNTRASTQLKSLFKFAQGVSHIWDRHELSLAGQERSLQEQLETTRKIHDKQNQDKEAALDIVMDKMRQESSENNLKESLKKALEMLEKIKQGYHKFHETQEHIIVGYPSMVKESLDKYNAELCKFFGVERHEEERDDEKEQKILKKTKTTTNKKNSAKKTPVTTPKSKKSPRKKIGSAKNGVAQDSEPEVELSQQNSEHDIKEMALQYSQPNSTASAMINDSETALDTKHSGIESEVAEEETSKVQQEDDVDSLATSNKVKDRIRDVFKEILITSIGTHFRVLTEAGIHGIPPKDKENGIGYITAIKETPIALPLYVECANLLNNDILQVKIQIRQQFLDHMDTWNSVALSRAHTVVDAKSEELESELRLRQHLHEPRSRRAELDVHNVRAAELVLHSERVTRHTKGITQTVAQISLDFQQLHESHDQLLEKFFFQIETMDEIFTSATKSTKLVTLINGLQNEVNRFMDTIRTSLRQFRQQLDEKLQMLREANSRFIKSFRLFSEGGNFCPEEVDDYRRRLDKMSHKIDEAESSVLSEMEGMEKQRLDQATKVSRDFEEKFRHHLTDLIFMEKIARFLTNTQVKIKTEVADSNSQAQKLAHALKEIIRRVDAVKYPNLDKEQIDGPKLNSSLLEVFKAFHDRSIYLNCMRIQMPPVENSSDGQPILAGPAGAGMRVMFSEPTPVSRAGRQPNEDPSIVVIKNILRSQKVRVHGEVVQEPEVEEQVQKPSRKRVTSTHGSQPPPGTAGGADPINDTESSQGNQKIARLRRDSNATSAEVKGRQPSASRRYVSKNQRLDKKYLVFGESDEENSQIHFIGRTRQICREAADCMLIVAESYYRQKGLRAVTRPQALQENFDQCAEVIISKLQSYFNQADEYHNTCLQEFRGQLEQLEKCAEQIPELMLNYWYQRTLFSCKNRMELSDTNFNNQLDEYTKRQNLHQEQLRPAMGHPSANDALEELQNEEMARHFSVETLLRQYKSELQNAVVQAGQEFALRVATASEQLFLQFDNLLTVDEVGRGRVEPTLYPTTELIRRKQAGKPLDDPQDETLIKRGKSNWIGLPLNEFMLEEKTALKLSATIITAKTTLGHQATDQYRRIFYERFQNTFKSLLQEIDDKINKFEVTEERWYDNWCTSVTKVKALYQ